MLGLNRQQTQELAIRALVTSVQGFLVAWATAGFSLENSVIGASVGAGASAGYNLVIKPWLESRKGIKRA